MPQFQDGEELGLPSPFSLFCHLLLLSVLVALLNSAASYLAFVPYAREGTLPNEVWKALSSALAERGANLGRFVTFASFAAFAGGASALGPIHRLHDRAIKFLYNVELCDRLASEILTSTYSSPREERTAWAKNINRNYIVVRKLGKFLLAVALLLMTAAILTPWVVVLQALGWNGRTFALVLFLFAPIVGLNTTEVWGMIWPGKHGLLLGEAQRGYPRPAAGSLNSAAIRLFRPPRWCG